IHNLLACNSCNKLWNRDTNAARNIYSIASFMQKTTTYVQVDSKDLQQTPNHPYRKHMLIVRVEIDGIREDYGQKGLQSKINRHRRDYCEKLTAIAATAVKNSLHFCWLIFDQKLTAIEILRCIQEALQYLIQLTEDTPKIGGSVPGRRYVNRNRVAGHQRLFDDYFFDDPVYTDQQFRRRFRMKRDLFLQIVETAQLKDEYFTQKLDSAGKPGLSPIQKVTAAMRQLAYGVSSDSVDEYIRLADSTAMESLKHFCHAIVAIYGDEYLRTPNSKDVKNF
ncbi:hypothetical protein INT47_004945, partial [Mucor saturninus]